MKGAPPSSGLESSARMLHIQYVSASKFIRAGKKPSGCRRGVMDHVQVISGAVRENHTAEVFARAAASIRSFVAEFARSLVDDRGKSRLRDEAKRKIEAEFDFHHRFC